MFRCPASIGIVNISPQVGCPQARACVTVWITNSAGDLSVFGVPGYAPFVHLICLSSRDFNASDTVARFQLVGTAYVVVPPWRVQAKKLTNNKSEMSEVLWSSWVGKPKSSPCNLTIQKQNQGQQDFFHKYNWSLKWPFLSQPSRLDISSVLQNNG